MFLFFTMFYDDIILLDSTKYALRWKTVMYLTYNMLYAVSHHGAETLQDVTEFKHTFIERNRIKSGDFVVVIVGSSHTSRTLHFELSDLIY